MTARAQFNNLTIWKLSILIAYNQATLPFLKNYFDFPGLSSKSCMNHVRIMYEPSMIQGVPRRDMHGH